MKIKVIDLTFSICKLEDCSQVDISKEFTFFSKTDEENSLVCPTDFIPENVVEREDGYCCFRIEGILDFSLVGILAKISTLLAQQQISIFAISTYNTDYILVREEVKQRAIAILKEAGYSIDLE